MTIKILDVENETVIDAVLLSQHTVVISDVGIVAFSSGSFNGQFGAVLLKYGLVIKDTVSDTMQHSFSSFLLKSQHITHWAIIGAETGAIGFCEKLNIQYPLNPEYR